MAATASDDTPPPSPGVSGAGRGRREPLGEDWDIANAAQLRHPWRWLLLAVIALLVAQAVYGLVNNGNFEWPVVRQYMTADVILTGLRTTVWLTALCMMLGIVLGVVVAAMRRSTVPGLRAVGIAYVWVFRGLPPLVQLIFWYNLAALFPRISLGIPFGPTFHSWSANTVITSVTAAILGLSLNEGAYMAEIIRAGLNSVDAGQFEAAKALGFGRWHTFRRIALPQAMRFIIPPTGSQVINMVKATSLVSVIAMGDLLYSAQVVYSRTFQTIPLLVVACLWYLIVTSILYTAQTLLERRYSRGSRRARTRRATRRFSAEAVREL